MGFKPIRVYQGVGNDLLFVGPGVATLDFSAWTASRFKGAGLTKTTTLATEAEVQNSGADLLIHLSQAEADALNTYAEHDYVLQVQNASGVWFNVNDPGELQVRPAVA